MSERGKPGLVLVKTASATLTHLEHDALITNRGATGTIVLTLPKAAYSKGIRYRFLRVATQAVQVNPDDDDQILDTDGTALTAGFHQELGSDGAMLEVESDGTVWANVGERGTINNET